MNDHIAWKCYQRMSRAEKLGAKPKHQYSTKETRRGMIKRITKQVRKGRR